MTLKFNVFTRGRSIVKASVTSENGNWDQLDDLLKKEFPYGYREIYFDLSTEFIRYFEGNTD